jgi:hypothetical protein
LSVYSLNGGLRSDACYDKLGERFIAPPYLCLASDMQESDRFLALNMQGTLAWRRATEKQDGSSIDECCELVAEYHKQFDTINFSDRVNVNTETTNGMSGFRPRRTNRHI